MVRHVAARTADRVPLLQAPKRTTKAVIEWRQQALWRQVDVGAEEIEQVVKASAVLDREPAIHVGLAEHQPRVDQQLSLDSPVMQANGDRRAGRAGIGARFPGRIN